MKEQEIPSKSQQYKKQITDSNEVYSIQQLENQVFSETIVADVTTNKKFLATHMKITLWLLFIILFLKILPSPVIIKTFQNQPHVFTKQNCNEEDCENISQQGFESITIKKINPLHRQLKYFARLNQGKMNELSNIFSKSKVELEDQVTWVEIYAVRDNDIYGEVIYEKSGKDINEVIFNNQPLFFIGEVHILSEVSYMVKIYKMIHKYKAKENLRLLESNNTITNSSDSTSNQSQNQTSIDGNQTNINEQTNQTNHTDQNNQTNQTSQGNETQHNNQTNNQNETKQVDKQISIPLSIQLVRYSEFYTGVQLLIRYVTFLIILYVAAETSECPVIFRIILFVNSNPLIFTQIAFPNTASNIISNMCSSIYMLYVPIFLLYTHRRISNFKVDVTVRIFKLIISLGLYMATVARSMHLTNHSTIQNIQYALIAVIMVPIAQYLWRMYFVRSKVVLHRDMLFVILAIYYFSLIFFSGYIVQYGWKNINFYLVVQAYGVSLCYLTSPKIRSKKKVANQVNNLSPSNAHAQVHYSHSNNINSIQIEPNSAKYKHEAQAQQLYVNIT